MSYSPVEETLLAPHILILVTLLHPQRAGGPRVRSFRLVGLASDSVSTPVIESRSILAPGGTGAGTLRV